MSSTANGDDRGMGSGACPAWCVTGHGAGTDEDDWLHLGEPVPVADGLSARLCMSLGPDADTMDGPYVVIGTREYTLPEAEALGASLLALAATGAIGPGGSRRRSRGL